LHLKAPRFAGTLTAQYARDAEDARAPVGHTYPLLERHFAVSLE
jgi:hypothetical protein